MGGSSKSRPQAVPAQTADTGYYSVSPVVRTIQPLAPGHLDRIAAQIAHGYGGTPDACRARMSAVYKPVELPDYPAAHRARATARQAAAEQPSAPAAPAPISPAVTAGSPFVYDPGNWRGGPY